MGDNAGKAHNRYLTKIGLTEAEFLLAKSVKEAAAKAKRTTHPDQSNRRNSKSPVTIESMFTEPDQESYRRAGEELTWLLTQGYNPQNTDGAFSGFITSLNSDGSLADNSIEAEDDVWYGAVSIHRSEPGVWGTRFVDESPVWNPLHAEELLSPGNMDDLDAMAWLTEQLRNPKITEQLRSSPLLPEKLLKLDNAALQRWDQDLLEALPADIPTDPARTRQLLEKLGSQPGMDSTRIHFNPEHLPPTHLVANVVQAIAQFNDAFPGVAPAISAWNFHDYSDDEQNYFACYGTADHSITFDELKETEDDPDRISLIVDDAFARRGVFHELGHALHAAIGHSSALDSLPEESRHVLWDHMEKIPPSFARPKWPSDIGDLDGYAYANGREFFAETVASIFFPDRPQEATMGDMSLFQQSMKAILETREILWNLAYEAESS